MSILRRFWQTLKQPSYLVGKDLEGNRYYEAPSTTDDPRRTRRRVEYNVGDMWSYVGSARRLPVQWTSWLSHTRRIPPTLDELQADLERQRRILMKAALIEARDREEQALIAAGPSFVPETSAHAPIVDSSRASKPPLKPEQAQAYNASVTHKETQASESIKNLGRPASKGSELPRPTQDANWQPEAWTPQTVRKRG